MHDYQLDSLFDALENGENRRERSLLETAGAINSAASGAILAPAQAEMALSPPHANAPRVMIRCTGETGY